MNLLEQLLEQRGIPEDKRDAFCSPDYEKGKHDPFLMNDMKKVVDRVIAARDADEKVIVYSDYDCDGIPAGTLMHDLLKKIGLTNFKNYIPHRHFDGFGLNTKAVESFAEEGVTLIITLDCGTVSFEPIARAKELGIEVIVIDHHEPEGDRLPDAYAVLNPKRTDNTYPFRERCATGVAFAFAEAMCQTLRKNDDDMAPPAGWEKWLLDLVALATVADMVPLVDENRVLARFGLTVLRQTRRPGLQQLFRKNRVNPRYLTEDDIGFTIAPRINAASRMDTPELGLRLLTAQDEGEAGAVVDELEKLNASRKATVAAMSREVHGKLAHHDELPPVIVIGDPEWKPSLVGLTANKLVDEYKRPAFVWGRDGKGIIKGSCRSPSVSVVKLMEGAREAFIAFGGHEGAGGFEVHDEKIHTLATLLADAYKACGGREDTSVKSHDIQCELDEINDRVVNELRTLAPFGIANPKPLFRIENVTPVSVELFGKTKEHTKLILKGKSAISFFKKPEDFTREPKAGECITLLAHVEESFFAGRLERRLRVIDVV